MSNHTLVIHEGHGVDDPQWTMDLSRAWREDNLAEAGLVLPLLEQVRASLYMPVDLAAAPAALQAKEQA